jgi:hypothetical protein
MHQQLQQAQHQAQIDPRMQQQVQQAQQQAQPQAQINLLQQKNAVLSQQLAHQATSNLSSPTAMPISPTLPPQSPLPSAQPVPPTPTPELTSSTRPSASTFDLAAMEHRLQERFKEDSETKSSRAYRSSSTWKSTTFHSINPYSWPSFHCPCLLTPGFNPYRRALCHA